VVFDGDGYGTIAAALTCLDDVAMMKGRGVDIFATNKNAAGLHVQRRAHHADVPVSGRSC